MVGTVGAGNTGITGGTHLSISQGRGGGGGRQQGPGGIVKSEKELVNWDSRKCSPTQHKCRDLFRQKFFS